MLKISGLSKEYEDKTALFDVSLTFPDKGLVIIKGESGSGKTTLLNLLTAHDAPTSGTIEFDGVKINAKNREAFRNKHCSNIYQDYMLIEDMTVCDNIELALQAYGKKYTLDDIRQLLHKVGIPEEYLKKQASKLSGGEKQRVSIARAIAKDDAMIFADEPTGNLDSQNGEIVMDYLKGISQDRLVVVVSHNEGFNVKYADYTVELVDGVVEFSDLPILEIDNEKKEENFDRKSKLKPKMLAKLTLWGFKKNRVKAVVSTIAFVMLCILSVMFSTLAFSDINLAYAKSLDKCQHKNFLAGVQRKENLTNDALIRFEDRLDNQYAEIFASWYGIYAGDIDEEADENFQLKYIKEYGPTPQAVYELIYNPQIGMDVDVLYGDFPKEYNEVMLPYCYAKYLSQVYYDYKCEDVGDLVGKTIKYGSESSLYKYYDFVICGIFEEGMYYTDFDTQQPREVINYYNDTNWLATCMIVSSQIKKLWDSDVSCSKIYNFESDRVGIFKPSIDDDMVSSSNMHECLMNGSCRFVDLYGYNSYNNYSNVYPPLAENEVYISKYLADYLGVGVGDTITKSLYRINGDDYNFDGVIIKDIIDMPDVRQGYGVIIFEPSYYKAHFLQGEMDGFYGFYFNMKGVKNVYSKLNKIRDIGFDEGIWWARDFSNSMDFARAENILVTEKFYEELDMYSGFVFLPLAILSLIGLVAMGFVMSSYLISSKGNAYAILRALGFGKGKISLVLAMQIFLIIIVGLIVGIAVSALFCHLIGKSFVKSLLKSAAILSTEVVLPMPYLAPVLVIAVSLLLGIAVVFAKTTRLFAKSIADGKQTEQ